MTDALFAVSSPYSDNASTAAPEQIPVKDHQVLQIREELDSAGLTTQVARQQAIHEIVKREVASLRQLTSKEAHDVIKRLRTLSNPKPSQSGSAWDQREEDTWIDKL